MNCYCGSGDTFTRCCKPVIEGTKEAETPEMLMRARYSAYVTGNVRFIGDTHDPDHQDGFDEEGAAEWSKNAHWLGLEIHSATGNEKDDTKGTVEFSANYEMDGTAQRHHEQSSFVKKNGKWFFVSGRMIVDQVVRDRDKIGRNDPCPCGSGKKYKKCCG
ncbi:MAG: YchJ family protein [Spirochaetales bacterium]|nr:YchJ family protein [Spirochaetales bacterium]